MPHIPNIHNTTPKQFNVKDPTSQPATPQAYVDTPNIIYSEWLKAVGWKEPLGKFDEEISVCIIGSGVAACVCAYELSLIPSVKVTLYEQNSDFGGRLCSERLPGPTNLNVAEMGAMRFPPSEDCLYYYAYKFGFSFVNNFPDPGTVDTLLSYKGEAMEWAADDETVPIAFETVYKGWLALMAEGVKDTTTKKYLIQPAKTMVDLLRNPSSETNSQTNSDLVASYWQTVLDNFGHYSFYQGIYEIFSGKNSNWTLPGGTAWTTDDFDKFGAIGIGSGGFGAIYSSGFCDVFRLVYNSLETNQCTFYNSDAGQPIAIDTMISYWLLSAQTLGGSRISIVPDAKATIVDTQIVSENDRPVVSVQVKNADGTTFVKEFDQVINTTSSRAMTIDQNLSFADTISNNAKFSSLLDADTAQAIQNIHAVPSGKLFMQTTDFWSGKTDFFPRVILSDTKAPQLYTLDYGVTGSGVTLMTYTWEDYSIQFDYLARTPGTWSDVVKDQIANLVQGQKGYDDYADNLVPLYTDSYIGYNWQSVEGQYGAFALPQPGQDVFVQQAFLDFLNPTAAQRGIYLAGDGISWTPGWVEGAIHTALNVLSIMLKQWGTVYSAAYAPSTLIPKYKFNYGVGSTSDKDDSSAEK